MNLKTFALAVPLMPLLAIAPRGARADEGGPVPLVAKISAGLGAEYGVLGGGVELGIPHLVLQGGLGTNILVGASWAVGAKAYFTGTTSKYRPFVSGMYGTPALYDVTVIDQRPGGISGQFKGTIRGFGAFAGMEFDVGSPGGVVLSAAAGVVIPSALPLEVTAALDSVGAQRPDWGPALKFAFGIGYRFGGASRPAPAPWAALPAAPAPPITPAATTAR